MADKKVNFRIIIFGAGAVGGVVGGLLALSGTPVTLIGRPSNVMSIPVKMGHLSGQSGPAIGKGWGVAWGMG